MSINKNVIRKEINTPRNTATAIELSPLPNL